MLHSPVQFRSALRGAGESGQSMVEFALVLPLVLIIVLGLLDVGKAVSYWQDETHLANEAARYAAVNKTPVSGQPIETAVMSEASTNELKNGGGSIDQRGCISISTPDGPAKGNRVVVTVTSKYKFLDFLFGSNFKKSITATSTMRLEQDYNDAGTGGPSPCP